MRMGGLALGPVPLLLELEPAAAEAARMAAALRDSNRARLDLIPVLLPVLQSPVGAWFVPRCAHPPVRPTPGVLGVVGLRRLQAIGDLGVLAHQAQVCGLGLELEQRGEVLPAVAAADQALHDL